MGVGRGGAQWMGAGIIFNTRVDGGVHLYKCVIARALPVAI